MKNQFLEIARRLDFSDVKFEYTTDDNISSMEVEFKFKRFKCNGTVDSELLYAVKVCSQWYSVPSDDIIALGQALKDFNEEWRA